MDFGWTPKNKEPVYINFSCRVFHGMSCISAPIALASHKIGSGKNVTSHPSVKDKIVAGEVEYYFTFLLKMIRLS